MILVKEMLEASHTDGERVDGEILVQSYGVQKTKFDKEYLSGVLMAGTTIPFKVWNNFTAFQTMKDTDLSGKVVHITGAYSLYKDSVSISIETITESTTAQVDDFLEVRYNAEAYGNALKTIVQQNVSEKGMSLANKVLFENEKVWQRFTTEFAARTHHDCFKSGLLAHTYKVTSLMTVVLNLYGAKLCHNQDEKDLYVLGALFHDIGKIDEYNIGNVTRKSIVTHQYLGVEYLDKDFIVSTYNEEWYYHLVSIILQHHGEWGMPPKSIGAKIVHQVDLLESMVQGIIQDTEGRTPKDTIKVDDSYLYQYNYE